MPNYNASQVGVPYVRASKITIFYRDRGQLPVVDIEQSSAVKLADNSVVELETLPTIRAELNLASDGLTPIPLVSPEDGSPLGTNTDLQQVYLCILAVVRKLQLAQPE